MWCMLHLTSVHQYIYVERVNVLGYTGMNLLLHYYALLWYTSTEMGVSINNVCVGA